MQPEIEESQPCPQCGALAEPEQDWDLKFWWCKECGAEFGYARVVPPGPVCAAGLPLASAAEESQAVFLGMTIKRRPDD